MAETLAEPRQRYIFIDLYRSVVILLMLEGHVFRVFLPSGLQQTWLFQIHEFIHGLSAPAFLFGAGLTFVISTRRRWVSYHHWDEPLERRVRRLVLVFLLGVMLHLPYFSIRKIIIDGTQADYLQLFQCDVLHCIGIGLLSLHALVFLFKSETKFYGLVLTTIVSVCFLTPLVWDVDALRFLPSPVAQMLNGQHGSPFPLFPYVGFLYAGVIVSWEFLIAVERKREKAFMRRVASIGVILLAAGILFDALPVHMYPTYNYWFTSPNYFFVRAGALMIALAGIWHIAGNVHSLPLPYTVLGRESLFVYVLHLFVLYGTAVNPDLNLRSMLGVDLTLLQTSMIFIALLVAMLVSALVWNYLKRKHFNLYRTSQLAGTGTFLYYFFTRDF